MKNIAKKITAIVLAVTLAATICPAIDSAGAETAKNETQKEKAESTVKAGNEAVVYSESEAAAGFNVVKIDTVAKTAEINWMGNVETIIVNFYDDGYKGQYKDRPPVYTKSINVTASPDELVTTNVTFDKDMPEYFILEILLKDGSGKDVADPYVTNQYTEAIREISDKTIEDFRNEGDRLVELAENAGAEEGSFLILADDVIRIDEGPTGQEGVEGAGYVQVEMMPTNGGDQLCTLNNIDSELSRQLDDIEYGAPVFITDETVGANGAETSYVMFKAKSASVDEKSGSAVLRGEVMESAGKNGEVNEEEMATYIKAASIGGKADYEDDWDDVWLPGGITFTAHMHGTMEVQIIVNAMSMSYFDFSVFLVDDRYCEDAEIDVNLPSIVIDIPVKTFSLGVKGIFEFEFSINIRFSGSSSGGVRFDFYLPTYIFVSISSRSGLGINNFSPDSRFEFEGVTFRGQFFAGVATGVAGSAFEMLSLSADLESGLEFSAEMNSGQYWDGKRKYHACEDFSCVGGDITFKKLGYSICANAGHFSNGISGDILPPKLLKNFYYSYTYDDYGLSECPHWGYRLNVHVTNQDGKDVSGAKVSYDITSSNDYADKDKERFKGLTEGTTDAQGIATIYMPENEFDIDITAKDEYGHTFKASKTFDETGDDPVAETLDIKIDMSRNKLSFIDTDQSGPAENMPDPVYTYDDEPSAAIPEKTPSKNNRVFVGWAAEQGSTEVAYNPGDPIQVKEDTQLYAIWAYDEYTIELDKNKPGNASNEIEGNIPASITIQYTEADSQRIGTMTMTGWEFKGWSRDRVPFSDNDLINEISKEELLKSDSNTIRLYAQWDPKPYNVTFVDQNGQEIREQGIYYDTPTHLISVEQLKLQNENSIFTYWTVEGSEKKLPDKAKIKNLCTVNEDGSLEGKTLKANWLTKTGATIIITDSGKFVDAGAAIKITLKDYENNEIEYDVEFKKESPGIYTVESLDIPEGTYIVVFDGEALQAYNTEDRSIEISEDFGAYNFDYYSVDAKCDGNGTLSVTNEDGEQVGSEDKLIRETKIKVSATAETGHHFEQYTILGSDSGLEWEPTKAEQTFTVTGDMVIEAHFVPNLYKIIFHDNDGGSDQTVKQDMVYGEGQNLFANQFERRGYKFAGWTTESEWKGSAVDYVDSQGVLNLTEKNDGQVHLYAQWTPAETFIVFNDNADGEEIKGEMLQQGTFYDSETTLSPCKFERDYWDFIGWNTRADGSGISYSDKAVFISDNPLKDSELTLYAQWKETEYTIDYDLAGGTVAADRDSTEGGAIKGNPATYNINTETFTLINPQRVGYEFLGWTGTGISGDPQDKVTISKGSHDDRKYTAKWKAEEKTLKFDPNGGKWDDGSTDIATVNADYDSTIYSPDAPSREYYTFEFWEDERGNKYIPGHEYKVRGDHEFKAIWKPVEYVIEYDLAGGSVAGDANPVVYTAETDDFALTAPEREGYVFIGWTGSNGDDPETEVMITKGSGGDKHYTANWKPAKMSPSEEGSKGEGHDKGTPTGDHFDPMLWGFLLLGSAAVLAGLVIRRRRKEKV